MKAIMFVIFGIFAVVSASGATLTDNFDSGISTNLWGTATWQTTTSGGYNVPVQMAAPDGSGRLQIIKSVEYSDAGLNSSFEYGLNSKFTIQGNFTISIDFSLLNFPQANPAGWSDAVLAIRLSNGEYFSCYRLADAWGGQVAGVAGGGSPGFGQISDAQSQGTFGITRTGTTIQGWIDHGQGAIQLGSITADWATADVQASPYIAQYIYTANNLRSSQAMDVRFDNFTVTADSITIPEPAILLLLGLGGMIVRKR